MKTIIALLLSIIIVALFVLVMYFFPMIVAVVFVSIGVCAVIYVLYIELRMLIFDEE